MRKKGERWLVDYRANELSPCDEEGGVEERQHHTRNVANILKRLRLRLEVECRPNVLSLFDEEGGVEERQHRARNVAKILELHWVRNLAERQRS